MADFYPWEELHHILCIARSFYTGCEIDNKVLGSLFVLPALTGIHLENLRGQDRLQNYLQWIFEGEKSGYILLKILVRPAGLEPATLCLEVRFRRIDRMYEFPSNIELLYSSSYNCLIEACRKLLAFEALTIYKIIYSSVWALVADTAKP